MSIREALNFNLNKALYSGLPTISAILFAAFAFFRANVEIKEAPTFQEKILYTASGCPGCTTAKALLQDVQGIIEKDISAQTVAHELREKLSGRLEVPTLVLRSTSGPELILETGDELEAFAKQDSKLRDSWSRLRSLLGVVLTLCLAIGLGDETRGTLANGGGRGNVACRGCFMSLLQQYRFVRPNSRARNWHDHLCNVVCNNGPQCELGIADRSNARFRRRRYSSVHDR